MMMVCLYDNEFELLLHFVCLSKGWFRNGAANRLKKKKTAAVLLMCINEWQLCATKIKLCVFTES